ncbi:hypothetical protein OROHE_023271 [Orobanche hederae]
MMSEAIDETLDKGEAEKETEDLTNQCLIRLVLILLRSAAVSTDVEDLEKRLASLR